MTSISLLDNYALRGEAGKNNCRSSRSNPQFAENPTHARTNGLVVDVQGVLETNPQPSKKSTTGLTEKRRPRLTLLQPKELARARCHPNVDVWKKIGAGRD
jgi:hypothetical protein